MAEQDDAVPSYSDQQRWLARLFASNLLTPGEKVTGAVLASHLNFKTGRLDPSAGRIAKLSNQTEGGVLRQLRSLRKHGFIQWARRGRTSNKYRLVLSGIQGVVRTGGPCLNGTSSGQHVRSSQIDGPQFVAPVGTTNLEGNLESNLKVDFLLQELKSRVGHREWTVLFEGLSYEPGAIPTIRLRMPNFRESVSHRHGETIRSIFGEVRIE